MQEKGRRGKNLTYLRSSNQGLAIKKLLTAGAASRNMLAAELGLTKMSISNLAGDLTQKGIVVEVEPETLAGETSSGRRPALLQLVPDSLYAVGVYISRVSVRTTLASIGGGVCSSLEAAHSPKITKQSLTETIAGHVRALLADAQGLSVVGVGIASIGLVDTVSGLVVSTTDFFGIADWPLRELLQAQISLPVYVVNDMKAASLAEHYYGAGKAYSDFVYLGITNGVGAGIVINGKLFEGARGFSSELGHTAIYGKSGRCKCGNTGCAELYLSAPALVQRCGLPSWAEFVALCQGSDTAPELGRILEDLGQLLVNIANSFDPQAVIVGHEGAQLGDYCFEQLQNLLGERAMTRRLKRIAVLSSALGENIVHLSGTALVFSHLFQGDITV